jgi:hypothetical protein
MAVSPRRATTPLGMARSSGMLHHEAPAPIATGSGWPLTQDGSGGNSPTERGLRVRAPRVRRFALAGFFVFAPSTN